MKIITFFQIFLFTYLITISTSNLLKKKKSLIKEDDSFAGNEIKDYGLVDTYFNSFIIDNNNPIKKNGIIDNFEIFSKTENPLRLIIYRGEGKNAKMVAESNLQIPKKGQNKFLINPLVVRKGDSLGIYIQSGGSVAYKLNDKEYTLGENNFTGKCLLTRPNVGYNTFFASSNRIYAIRAEVKNEPPVTENFAGNELKNYERIDTYKNSYICDTNNPVKEDGIISNFEVYAKAKKAVRLVIYRGKGKDMKMVAESRLEFPANIGENSFTIKPILVKKGDYLGLYFSAGGSVAYKLNDPTDTLGDNNFTGKVLITKENHKGDDFYTSTNRVYALRANVESIENFVNSMYN